VVQEPQLTRPQTPAEERWAKWLARGEVPPPEADPVPEPVVKAAEPKTPIIDIAALLTRIYRAIVSALMTVLRVLARAQLDLLNTDIYSILSRKEAKVADLSKDRTQEAMEEAEPVPKEVAKRVHKPCPPLSKACSGRDVPRSSSSGWYVWKEVKIRTKEIDIVEKTVKVKKKTVQDIAAISHKPFVF